MERTCIQKQEQSWPKVHEEVITSLALACPRLRNNQVSPSEVQEGFGGGGNAEVGPGQEVELRHGPSLVGLEVLQVEAPHEVIVAPDVLGDEVHL